MNKTWMTVLGIVGLAAGYYYSGLTWGIGGLVLGLAIGYFIPGN